MSTHPSLYPSRPAVAGRLGFCLRATLVLLVVSCGALAGADAEPDEVELIAEALGLRAGATVADVGAGSGRWSEALAGVVGAEGRVVATEVDAGDLRKMRRRFRKLEQVEVVEGDQERTGLEAGCCDAILLRMVYHHFQDPPTMRSDLERALRRGGRILVVDIEPQEHWRDLPGVPDRGGHGIPAASLIAEMAAEGFVVERRYPSWPGEEDRYAVLFRRP